MSSLIALSEVSFAYPHKTLFQGFSATIAYGDRIALTGSNGAGKSTLLAIITGEITSHSGLRKLFPGVSIGFVRQMDEQDQEYALSGGQSFNKALTKVLLTNPDLLVLDEPTNHLDKAHRASLMRLINSYRGAVLVVSHDQAFIEAVCSKIWHISHEKVTVFYGNYEAFLSEQYAKEAAKNLLRTTLKKEEAALKKPSQKENTRAARSKKANKHENDKMLKGSLKEQGSRTIGKNAARIAEIRDELLRQKSTLLPEKITVPTFGISAQKSYKKTLISIRNGVIGYTAPLVHNITLSITNGEKIAIEGRNGSGKSTLIKALLQDKSVIWGGEWECPTNDTISVLDQRYSLLDHTKTVFDTILLARKDWTLEQVRRHLIGFLFRSQAQVSQCVKTLSGGEKVRLALALIAVHNRELLILDEVTNNIDAETRAHLIMVLKQYRGTLIVISHDAAFLDALEIERRYTLPQTDKHQEG